MAKVKNAYDKKSGRFISTMTRRFSNTDLAWIAGYIEAKGFSVVTPRITKSGRRTGHTIHFTSGSTRLAGLEEFARKLGRHVYTWKSKTSFGEKFEHFSRPAVYTDSKSVMAELTIHSTDAKVLFSKLIPYLSRRTFAKVEHVINWTPPPKIRIAGKFVKASQ